LKIKLYRYVLITVAFLIGFQILYAIMDESYIIRSLMDADEWTLEYIAEIRLRMTITNILTFLYCLILVGIAVGLYFAEFGICKYIDNKRKSNN